MKKHIDGELAVSITFNIILPLFLGFIIYLFINHRTYIHILFPTTIKWQINSKIEKIIVCWMGDMFWSYALTFALYFSLAAFKRRIVFSAILSALLGTILELLQQFGIVSGTFDILDVIFEIMAVCLAVIVIKRRETI